MTARALIFLSILTAGLTTFAQEIEPAERRFLNGHNLSITSDVLRPGRAILGLDICALGLNDTLSLGSSTWMYTDYKMASLALREQFGRDDDGNLWAVQSMYLQTLTERTIDNYELGTYQMRSLWTMLVRTYRMAPHYRLHLNLHANYYWDQKMPFSLRRPSKSSTPFQFNATSLHELDLVGNWYVLGEIGLLDFARDPFYVHTGASIGHFFDHFNWHMGFSISASPRALFSPIERRDYQQRLRAYAPDGFDTPLDDDAYASDYAIHPEMSLQVLF